MFVSYLDYNCLWKKQHVFKSNLTAFYKKKKSHLASLAWINSLSSSPGLVDSILDLTSQQGKSSTVHRLVVSSFSGTTSPCQHPKWTQLKNWSGQLEQDPVNVSSGAGPWPNDSIQVKAELSDVYLQSVLKTCHNDIWHIVLITIWFQAIIKQTSGAPSFGVQHYLYLCKHDFQTLQTYDQANNASLWLPWPTPGTGQMPNGTSQLAGSYGLGRGDWSSLGVLQQVPVVQRQLSKENVPRSLSSQK